jgi:hypothetical protein
MEQPKGHFSSNPLPSDEWPLHLSRNLYPGSQHAYTIRPFPLLRSSAARCMGPRGSEPCNRNPLLTPKLAPNGTPFPLSRQIVKQFSSSSSPPYKKRIKDERTGSVKSERKTGLSSMTSDSRNRCRIVAAPRSRESILTERKFPRAEVAVWVLSKIRNFRISTSRFNVR